MALVRPKPPATLAGSLNRLFTALGLDREKAAEYLTALYDLDLRVGRAARTAPSGRSTLPSSARTSPTTHPTMMRTATSDADLPSDATAFMPRNGHKRCPAPAWFCR